MPNRVTGSAHRPRDECRALLYTVRPHDENNHMDKAITAFLFLLWGSITLLLALGAINSPPEVYGGLTAFVWYRVGTIKEREAARLAAGDGGGA